MKPRIAVFDPSPNLLRLFQVVLSRYGYCVLPFDQEVDRVDQLEKLQPSAIILGYFRGYLQDEAEVVKWVRSQPGLRKVPIIITSTGSVEFQDDKLVDNVSILPKPFDTEVLLDTLKEGLQATAGA